MNKGVEKLGNVLFNQMQGVSDHANRNAAVQLGKITSGLGLKLDSVNYTIPKSDYMVIRSAMLSNDPMQTNVSGGHKHTVSGSSENISLSIAGNHRHSVNMPTCFRPIQPGDRVLVAMVGTEPIVIDIVVPADSGAFGG